MKFILKSVTQQISGKIAETTFCFNKEQNKHQWRQDFEQNGAYIDIIEFKDIASAKSTICNFAGIQQSELLFHEDTMAFLKIANEDECYTFCNVKRIKS